MLTNAPPVFRFAPSPNGALHLGHAYSALTNQELAKQVEGRCLLRVEDIDQQRCNSTLEKEMLNDLAWLGIEWETPPRRQSEHFSLYRAALSKLREKGVIYPAFMSRGDIRRFVADNPDWPKDPDGSPHYPGDERNWTAEQLQQAIAENPLHALRLNMAKALEQVKEKLDWVETGSGPEGQSGIIKADTSQWGDVILARSDTPTSYHISVVVDDGEQGITHVVRGQDLFFATSLHRLLQTLLELPAPAYHHHQLILNDKGRKLSKSAGDTSLRVLRSMGVSVDEIKQLVGL